MPASTASCGRSKSRESGPAATRAVAEAGCPPGGGLGAGPTPLPGLTEPLPRAGRRPQPPRPFGARLIDTRDWTIRTLHPDAILIHRAGERLLANGTVWRPGGEPA